MFFPFKKKSKPEPINIFKHQIITDRIFKLHQIEFEREITHDDTTLIYKGIIRSTEDHHGDKFVTVKVLISKNKLLQEKFEAEAALYTRLYHENLIRIEFTRRINFGTPFGTQRYIVMEYIDGVTCKDIINYLAVSGNKLPARTAIEIVSKVLRALDSVFNLKDNENNPLKIIHADISPHNILISKQGQVKLIDFGIAISSSDQQGNNPEVIAGKFAYMSPEQASGKTLDQRSDLYSLTVVFAELLLAVRLNKSVHTNEVLECTLHANYPILNQTNLEPALLRIIKKNLTPAIENRFKSASAMLEALEELIAAKALFPKSRDLIDLISDVLRFHNEKTCVEEVKVALVPETPKEKPCIKEEPPPARKNTVFKLPEILFSRRIKSIITASTGIAAAFILQHAIFLHYKNIETALISKDAVALPPHLIEVQSSPPQILAASLDDHRSGLIQTKLAEAPTSKKDQPVTTWHPQFAISSNGAQISVISDGKKWNATGMLAVNDLTANADVTAKNFTATISKNGYKTKSVKFSLTPKNAAYKTSIVLDPAQLGALYVGASPWAQITIPGFINNKEIPLNLKLPEGAHMLIAKYQDDDDKWHKLSKQILIRANTELKCLVFFNGNDKVECN